MAKPMLVTLPFALLLLDYWPLRRFTPGNRPSGQGQEAPGFAAASSPRLLVLEKLPLLALSAGSCVLTWYVQTTHAVRPLQDFPLPIRVGNALSSYAAYLGKTLWPVDLAVFYPHPGAHLAWGHVAAASALLVVLTAGALAAWRRLPYIAVGWLWYLGTLVPVLGIVQVGFQGMADRYTYLPHLGLFILAVWAIADLAGRWRCQEAAAILAGIVLAALMAVSWRQVGYWHDSITLWEHTLQVTRDNSLAHYELGMLLERDPRRRQEALPHYAETVRISPQYAQAHHNLARALQREGRVPEAMRHYAEAVRLDPGYALAHFNLGILLLAHGRAEEASGHLQAALANHPEPGVVSFNLGRAFALRENWPEAVTNFRQALSLRPEVVRIHCSLAFALHKMGRTKEAEAQYRESFRLDPHWLESDNRRAWETATGPDAAVRNGLEAVELAQQVCQATGNANPYFLDTLAAAYAEAGRFDQAAATARAAIRLAASADHRQQLEARRRLYEKRLPFRSGEDTGNRDKRSAMAR
jgi:tetratricopeptide (TPR) repeat protein